MKSYFVKYFILILLLFPCLTFGQTKEGKEKLYRVNKVTSSIIVGVGFTTNAIGLKILDNRSEVTVDDIFKLNKNKVPQFEKWILNQNSDNFQMWQDHSDVVMRSSLILPAIFLLNKRIQDQWLDYSLMYLKTQAFSANFYTLGIPQFYRKNRPEVYYENLTIEQRTGIRLSNSFFSGHTSVTATSFFFMASVYHDLYPKRNLILPLGLASLGTGFVAMARIKGGKHFLTDVVAGAIVGGMIGYFTPHFHSKKRKKNPNEPNLSFDLGYKSLNLTYTF